MEGLNSECDGKVWRVDVGMSSGVLNADAQVFLSSTTWRHIAFNTKHRSLCVTSNLKNG